MSRDPFEYGPGCDGPIVDTDIIPAGFPICDDVEFETPTSLIGCADLELIDFAVPPVCPCFPERMGLTDTSSASIGCLLPDAAPTIAFDAAIVNVSPDDCCNPEFKLDIQLDIGVPCPVDLGCTSISGEATVDVRSGNNVGVAQFVFQNCFDPQTGQPDPCCLEMFGDIVIPCPDIDFDIETDVTETAGVDIVTIREFSITPKPGNIDDVDNCGFDVKLFLDVPLADPIIPYDPEAPTQPPGSECCEAVGYCPDDGSLSSLGPMFSGEVVYLSAITCDDQGNLRVEKSKLEVKCGYIKSKAIVGNEDIPCSGADGYPDCCPTTVPDPTPYTNPPTYTDSPDPYPPIPPPGPCACPCAAYYVCDKATGLTIPDVLVSVQDEGGGSCSWRLLDMNAAGGNGNALTIYEGGSGCPANDTEVVIGSATYVIQCSPCTDNTTAAPTTTPTPTTPPDPDQFYCVQLSMGGPIECMIGAAITDNDTIISGPYGTISLCNDNCGMYTAGPTSTDPPEESECPDGYTPSESTFYSIVAGTPTGSAGPYEVTSVSSDIDPSCCDVVLANLPVPGDFTPDTITALVAQISSSLNGVNYEVNNNCGPAVNCPEVPPTSVPQIAADTPACYQANTTSGSIIYNFVTPGGQVFSITFDYAVEVDELPDACPYPGGGAQVLNNNDPQVVREYHFQLNHGSAQATEYDLDDIGGFMNMTDPCATYPVEICTVENNSSARNLLHRRTNGDGAEIIRGFVEIDTTGIVDTLSFRVKFTGSIFTSTPYTTKAYILYKIGDLGGTNVNESYDMQSWTLVGVIDHSSGGEADYDVNVAGLLPEATNLNLTIMMEDDYTGNYQPFIDATGGSDLTGQAQIWERYSCIPNVWKRVSDDVELGQYNSASDFMWVQSPGDGRWYKAYKDTGGNATPITCVIDNGATSAAELTLTDFSLGSLTEVPISNSGCWFSENTPHAMPVRTGSGPINHEFRFGSGNFDQVNYVVASGGIDSDADFDFSVNVATNGISGAGDKGQVTVSVNLSFAGGANFQVQVQHNDPGLTTKVGYLHVLNAVITNVNMTRNDFSGIMKLERRGDTVNLIMDGTTTIYSASIPANDTPSLFQVVLANTAGPGFRSAGWDCDVSDITITEI